MSLQVHILPIIPSNHNYAYVLVADNGQVAVVDPGEAAPIIKFLESEGLKPDFLLITHHHWDHTDGIAEMLEWHRCPVAGPSKEFAKIEKLDIMLDEFSVFEFGGEDIQIIETPGHTLGHICYFFPQSQILLSGDTLFSMGCGRLFEGTPEQMWESFQKILKLPPETQIYCGHEYTAANAKFCLGVEPDNKALQTRAKEVESLSAKQQPTLPVSLQTEKETNVFLRAASPAEFATLRAQKDKA